MYLSLSEPQRNKDFSRLGWIIFDTEENCDAASEALNNIIIKHFNVHIIKSSTRKKPIKVTVKINDE